MSWSRLRSVLALPPLLAACTTQPSVLPEGWSDAEPAPAVQQSTCEGDPYGADALQQQFSARLDAVGHVFVTWERAHFRCAQEVAAWWRADGTGHVDVLVQPADLTPESVARCDCLYTLEIELGRPAPLASSVGLWTRGDVDSGRGLENLTTIAF